MQGKINGFTSLSLYDFPEERVTKSLLVIQELPLVNYRPQF